MDEIKVPVALYADTIEAIKYGLRYIPLGDSSSDFCRRVLRELKGEPEKFLCGHVVGECTCESD